MKTTEATADSYTVRAVSRALAVLGAFAGSEELTLVELSQQVGIAKPTVFRIAATLAQHGLLERTATGSYRLGLALVSIARLALDRSIAKIAHPFMEELFRAFGHSVNLAVLDGGQMLLVDVIESRHSLRMAGSVGAREPLHATAIGKAVAAFLPPEGLDAILEVSPLTPLTPKTVTTRTQFGRELDRVRQRGWATDLGEFVVGAHCVAAPIFGDRGPIAGLSISAPAEILPTKDISIVGPAVQQAATQVSLAAGGPSGQNAG